MVYHPLSHRHATAMAMGDRLRSLSREQTEQALNVIVGIMNSVTAAHRDRLKAATIILDRGWGKPTQLIEASMREGGEIRRKLTYEVVHVSDTPTETLVDDENGDGNGSGREPDSGKDE